jgi:hypothetical protein
MHDDRIRGEQRPHCGDVEEILLPKEEPREPSHLGQVSFFHGPGIERIEIVHSDNLIALGSERLYQMRANEAGGARNQDATHLPPRPIP